MKYTILSTFPPHASGNVGDKLLEEQTKSLIRKETGVDEFETAFRTTDFSSTIAKLNESDAIILPAFAIREPIHPDTYALVEDLDAIDPPIIPIASNWTHYPGDEISAQSRTFSEETVAFLRRLKRQDALSRFTTRDRYTTRILARHGFHDAELVGDLGWYHEDYLGESMRVPRDIDHIVMTTPHNDHYVEQAKAMMDMLIAEFPDAAVTVSFHSVLDASDRDLREAARDRGFDIVLASHDTDNIAFYDQCDLHVGYRLHGHISFLRRRLPSVLIGEDGRGNGFNATLGVGGFEATTRRLGPRQAEFLNTVADSLPGRGLRKIAKGGWSNPHKRILAPADMTVPRQVRKFLRKELENGFESYAAVPELFDTTYKDSMKPFLKTLPAET